MPGAAGLAAVIGALWNPYVGERLVVGHWTVLLGYAVLPWLWRAVLCLRAGGGSIRSVAGWLALASAGGANSLPHPDFPYDDRLRGLPSQLCYLDEPTSEVTNDLCVRWNAPLVHVAAFLDQHR